MIRRIILRYITNLIYEELGSLDNNSNTFGDILAPVWRAVKFGNFGF
jgi:hypothetical protein